MKKLKLIALMALLPGLVQASAGQRDNRAPFVRQVSGSVLHNENDLMEPVSARLPSRSSHPVRRNQAGLLRAAITNYHIDQAILEASTWELRRQDCQTYNLPMAVVHGSENNDENLLSVNRPSLKRSRSEDNKSQDN